MAANEIAVGWFEIYVEDMPRAKKFYETVFNTMLSEMPMPTGEDDLMCSFSMMPKNGAGGALVKMKGVKPSGMNTIVYFSSVDCAEEESRVEAAGGKVFQSKISIREYGFICLLIDTEGNTFGLHSQK